MRIGMLVNNLSVSGGYQKCVLRVSENLERRGHNVFIYTLDLNRSSCYPDIIHNFNIVSISGCRGREKKKSKLLNYFDMRRKFKALANLMDTELDALIVHDEMSLNVLKFFTVHTFKETRILWILHNQLSSIFTDLPTHFSKHFESTKTARIFVGKIVRVLPVILNVFNRYSLRRAVALVDVFAVYDSFNKELVEKFLKRPANVIYGGADIEDFSNIFPKRRYSKKSLYKIISTGVVFPHRRYEDLIEAVSILRDKGLNLSLTIIGLHKFSPEYASNLLNLVRRLNLENSVSFHEYASDGELRSIYRDSDIFAFVNDGFSWGISVVEAIASGLPVIITNNIGMADMIRHKHSGWIVNPRRPLEIALAVEEIVSNPKLVKAICENGRNEVFKKLSWQAYTERLVSLLS